MYSAALIIFLLSYIPASLRWKTVSESIGYEISLRDSLRIMSAAYGLNKIAPGNAGDIGRSGLMKRLEDVDSHFKLLGGVAVERAFDLATVILLIVFSGLMVGRELLNNLWIFIIPATAVLILGSVLIYRGYLIEPLLRFLPEMVRSRMEKTIEGFRAMNRKQFVRTGGFSMSKWAIEGFSFYLLTLSLGMDTGVWLAVLVTSIMSLIAALPITPAGLGPVDAVATSLLVLAGFTASESVSLVVLQRSLGVLLMGLVGFAGYSSLIHSSSRSSS